MIKLLNIRLVNFKKFYSGMNKKEVYINFENCPFKTIMIEGPNGAGKTSLLEELNPLPGVRNTYSIIKGETGEKTVTFKGNDNRVYQVQYMYVPNKDTHLCKGNLYVIINGTKKSIIQNSSVTETVNKVKELTGYDNKLHKIASIGIGADERGIVYMGSSERRAYLQAIGPLGDIRDKVKIINDKYIYTKKSIESIENRLGKLESSDSLLISKRNLNSEKESLSKKLDDSRFQNVRSSAELNEMNNQLNEYKEDTELLSQVINFIQDNKIEGNINTYNEDLQEQLGTKKGIVIGLNDRLASIVHKLSICNISKTRNIVDVKNDLDAHEFNQYKDTSVRYLNSTNELLTLKTIYGLFKEKYVDTMGMIPSGVSINDLINNPDIDIESIRKKMSDCVDEMSSLRELKESTFVPLGWQVERSSTCEDNECPLYKKFLTIYEKTDKYKEASKRLDNVTEKFNELNSALAEAETKAHVVKMLNNIYSLIDDSDTLKILNPEVFGDSAKFKKALMDRRIFQYDNDLQEIAYVTSLHSSYNSILEEYNNIKNNDVDNLNIEKENILSKLSVLREDIAKLTTKISKSIRNNKFSSLSIAEAKSEMNAKQESRYDLAIIYKQAIELKNEYDTYKSNNASALDRIKEIDASLLEISNKLYLRNALEEELSTSVKDFADISKVKETLTKHLPNKVMNKIMLNLKDVTNEFLETTDLEYRVHSFEVTSKDFIIRIQNGSTISSDIKNMSQGEMSIMTLATTLALNKIFLPSYSIMTMDEIDATLSEENRRKFLNILEAYRSFKDLQLFVVSHNRYYNATSDVGVISLRTDNIELKIKPLVENDL